MNYLALKNMIDVITQTYRCPECSGLVDDSHIEIMWTAGNTINVDIYCSKCEKHSIMKAEVTYIWKNIINKSIIEKIKNNFPIKNDKTILEDKDIIDLNNKLKNDNIDMNDLF